MQRGFKKILIVGGGGFLGRHLAKQLNSIHYDIRILDRFKPQWIDDQYDFCEGDFTATHLLSEVMDGCDVIFHLASTTLPKSSNDDPQFDVSTNLLGTLGLLDLAVQKKIKKFIFASSGGTVYGSPSKLPVPENHATKPACSYGIVKLAIEKYLTLYHQMYGLETCALRLANPYGEFQRVDSAQGAVAVFCHKALRRETIEIWGDGSVVRDFIYVEDVINAMVKTLEVDCAGTEINIGSGIGISLEELLAHIEKEVACQLDVQKLPARSLDVPEIYLDISKTKRVLDWEPKVKLEKGLARLVSWMKSGPG